MEKMALGRELNSINLCSVSPTINMTHHQIYTKKIHELSAFYEETCVPCLNPLVLGIKINFNMHFFIFFAI